MRGGVESELNCVFCSKNTKFGVRLLSQVRKWDRETRKGDGGSGGGGVSPHEDEDEHIDRASFLALQKEATDLLSLFDAHGPQGPLYGQRNLWAVKPQTGTRSTGIFLSNRSCANLQSFAVRTLTLITPTC